jgi:hypothetical protein
VQQAVVLPGYVSEVCRNKFEPAVELASPSKSKQAAFKVQQAAVLSQTRYLQHAVTSQQLKESANKHQDA